MPTLLALFASNACASVVAGKVWAWGLDNQGSLGDELWSGETGTPVEVQGINEIYAVAGGTDEKADTRSATMGQSGLGAMVGLGSSETEAQAAPMCPSKSAV